MDDVNLPNTCDQIILACKPLKDCDNPKDSETRCKWSVAYSCHAICLQDACSPNPTKYSKGTPISRPITLVEGQKVHSQVSLESVFMARVKPNSTTPPPPTALRGELCQCQVLQTLAFATPLAERLFPTFQNLMRRLGPGERWGGLS